MMKENDKVRGLRLLGIFVIIVVITGCQTMDMAAIKSKVGLGGDGDAKPESTLKAGPKPVEQTVTTSPVKPPSSITPPATAPTAVTQLIGSEALTKEYNGVLVAFLAQEAKQWMPDKERRKALDQAVTALKDKINITKGEQIETGLGTAVGMMMQLAGGDIVGEAGASVTSDYFAEVSDWIDAASDLASLGYKEDAGRFFEYGMKNFPHDTHRGRCVAGYAKVHPDKAYDFLMSKLEGPASEDTHTVIRMLGHLVASGGLNETQKTKVMETIAGYAQGLMNTTYYLDAIYALDRSGDPRAVAPLKKFMKGMMVSDEQQRPALTSLALTYKDAEAIEVLKSIVNAGAMATYDWRDKQFAFRVLVRAGEEEAYAYAEANLLKRSKGFLAAKDAPDPDDLNSDIIDILVRYGDIRGARAMAAAYDKYDDDEWIKTWMATAMMMLGDSSAMDLAKTNIDRPGWEFTSVSIAQALALYGDYSGVKTLERLISMRQIPPSPRNRLLKAMAGRDDTKAQRERLERLRIKTAHALGRIDQVSCVPLLATLLEDEADAVRRSAANALVNLSVPEALPAMVKALGVKYGVIKGQELDSTPATHARLVRATGNRWGADPKVQPVMTQAGRSPYASVRMIAAAMQR